MPDDLNEEFRPTSEEIEQARRVLTAYDQPLAEGVGAVTVDEKLIDVPGGRARPAFGRATSGYRSERGADAKS